jgi:nicotinate-nucleotide adenylyltransferase
MDIGLYFGSFNPIHHGHLIIAKHVINATSLNQLWFVVSPQNPFKAAGNLLNEYHRLHLVNTAIDGETALRANDIEFHLPRPSYSADTLTYLSEKYPQHKFSLLMGSDSLANLRKWKNADFIISNYPIYVYMRPGFPLTEIPGANLQALEAPLLQISATHIRELVRQGKSIRYLVPDSVMEEIERNHYYR